MLPKEFEARMERLLGTEAPAFFEALGRTPQKGLYVNRLLLGVEQLKQLAPFLLLPSPYSPDAFLVAEGERPGTHPLFAAGAYYVQEPSAMCAAEALGAEPGERVLDLCAAPGGKACRLAGRVGRAGLLVANEIQRGRARVLASNLERMGARAVVTSAEPERLAEALPQFFDRVMVDAPCSGEGMFRKDEGAVADWSEAHVAACAHRQGLILRSADRALRPGGVLVYSTCTFAPEENEAVVAAFAAERGYTIEEITAFPHSPGLQLPGMPEEIRRCARLFPHRQPGEGHFVARLRKGDAPAERMRLRRAEPPAKERLAQWEKLSAELAGGKLPCKPVRFGEYLYAYPEELPAPEQIGAIWPGVQLARCERGRLEPCHHLFKAFGEQIDRWIDLEGEAVDRFLRGETLPCGEKGYCGVRYEGLPLGFGKASGGTLKNRYPKGLRTLAK